MILIHRGKTVEFSEGETYFEAAERFKDDYDAPIILAKIGERLVELNKKIDVKNGSTSLSFITTADPDGHRTYERGATMMFLRAMTRVYGKSLKSVKLQFSVSDGLFFTAKFTDSETFITPEKLAEVKSVMERYVSENEKFVKSKDRTEDTVAIFRRFGMSDKERLFHYRRSSTTNVYRLGNYVDYYYGYMPPSTGYINVFDLKLLDGGVLLVLPNKAEPGKPGKSDVPQKLFATMRDTNIWGENIGVPTVAALNDAISRGDGQRIVLASEAHQEHLIGKIAERIKTEGRRIVMIAGPSSSGKTSFSHRLAIQLGNYGLRAHPLALDNYYVERTKTPRDENGEYDFECLEALNIELFNDNMKALLRGERASLPVFNFKTGLPEFGANEMAIDSDEVLVIEGIHGLNDRLSYAIDAADKFKIYISAVTALNIDEHNRIPTTDNREIRRMVRDARTRGFSATDTISRWQSVRRGEEKHIFPFQESCDVMFNSASLYELAVLKIFAEPLLFSIAHDAPEYPEAKRLLKFLEYFLALSTEDVPKNSIVREFIGGSAFNVG